MKIKPVVQDRIQIRHTSYNVDFALEGNVTFIIGDSGTGKSAVFSFLREIAAENKSIVCFNYLDSKKYYKKSIKQYKEKLIVIDNADILLDDNMRRYISLDEKNQYIIIGRNPTGLMLGYGDIYELKSEPVDDQTCFTLVKAFSF